MNQVFDFYNKLKADKFCFLYRGHFSDEITDKLLRLGEKDSEEEAGDKKLPFLIAECFQNIIRYADKPDIVNRTNNKPPVFSIRKISRNSYISSANLVENAKLDALSAKLKDVNSLGNEELRFLYRNVLADGNVNNNGGAGLGLIEMARKSGQNIVFDFEHVNYFLSLFYMQVNLKKEEELHLSIDDFKALYKWLNQEDLLMVYKGDFSNATLLPILNMMESNLGESTKDNVLRKKIIFLLIELLQNINRHSATLNGEHEGIMFIGRKDNHHVIHTGNLLGNHKTRSFSDYIDLLNGKDELGLIDMYKKRLLEGQSSKKANAKLGLIDIARYSHEKIALDIHPVDEEISFVTIGVKI